MRPNVPQLSRCHEDRYAPYTAIVSPATVGGGLGAYIAATKYQTM
jgi:hypothetical protein